MFNRRVNKTLMFSMTTILTLFILISIVGSATARLRADSPGKDTPLVPAQAQGPADPAELESFLDELLGKQMKENNIAGAAVSVVKDGKLFFAKGYGYADIEKGILVDPDRTLFRIGSVTKLFTWTAVMQLVEQGKLDLDADINTYLDFHIPDTYVQPITLKHLMTHTAGFEDLHVDLVTLKEENLARPGKWLASHIPGRVLPPGEFAAYSNYGAALAGYIVARVTGESYSQYVQQHILNPLGMKNSTALSPTPPELRTHESVGYMNQDGDFQVFPRLLGPEDLFPAGVIRSTSTDMARFMIAHLQGGRYSDDSIAEERILGEDIARKMQGTLFTHDARLMGTAYGFFDFSDNGQQVIGHSGGAEPMYSLLLLLPHQNLGIFVTYNSLGADALTRQHFGFQRAFFDHYYPAHAVEPVQVPVGFVEQAGRFVGAYRWTLTSQTTLEKYAILGSPSIVVKNPGDGTLLMESPYGNWRVVEVEQLYFRQVDGPFGFAFREDGQGRITHLFSDFTPMFAFEKSKWYETLSFNMPLLLVSLLIFLSMLPVALIRGIRNRRMGEDQNSPLRGARVAYRLIVGISILNLLFVVGTLIWGQELWYGIPLMYKVVLGLGVLSAVLTAGALVYALLAWKDSYWGVAFRVYYTLATVAAVAFVWFLNYWNLLGWRY
jgi:CubicO group peptidase (beta-lactamase class C family)